MESEKGSDGESVWEREKERVRERERERGEKREKEREVSKFGKFSNNAFLSRYDK